ncbi:transmembrane and death domain protein 1 [Rhineura floridana]|uniref:transmembrane and death domain protein 1 n=1 Tax=Rhineura floridana TaxID=261503 RepID=UPI002AC8121E|nr:transmembrane and death domain protein 1 [Rhineura floridana]
MSPIHVGFKLPWNAICLGSKTSQMLPRAGIALFLLTVPVLCDDTVADDIGSHMMGRISELLSSEECQAFYVKLLSPEENVREELERLSAEKNPIRTRRRRDITSTEQCKETLNRWLDAEGDTMYWDRLSRALQAIGRSDVSIELGKNLNQDKNLEMKKNVEEYHKTVKHLTSSLLLDENEGSEDRSGQGRLRREGERSGAKFELGEWDDFELIIERKPLPPYNRSLFGWVTPVTTGVIGGFLTSFILVALALYSFLWILNQGRPVPMEPSWDSVPDLIFRSLPRRGAIYYTFQQFDELEKCDSEPVDDDDESLEKELIIEP